MFSCRRWRSPFANAYPTPPRYSSLPVLPGRRDRPPGINTRIALQDRYPRHRRSEPRDYEGVVDFFTHYLHRSGTPSHGSPVGAKPAPTCPIELVLLGNSDSAYGTSIVHQLKKTGIPPLHHPLLPGSYTEAEYEQRLSEADLLWSPLKVQKVSMRSNPETYGLTTASGLTADLLLNATPALVPADFTIPESFRAAMFPYRSNEEVNADHRPANTRPPPIETSSASQIHASFTFFTKETFTSAFTRADGLTDPNKS